MAISLFFTPLFRHSKPLSPPKPALHKPLTSSVAFSAKKGSRYSSIARCGGADEEKLLAAIVPPDKPGLEEWLAAAASLYPLYVTAGGALAFVRPSSFSWFVNLGPSSYSLTLGLIMLSMGITLEFKELIDLFRQRPLSVSSLLLILLLNKMW